MPPEQIIRSARDAGVILYLDAGKLAFKARAGQFTAPLRDLVRANREELVAWLSAQPGQASRIAPLGQAEYPLSHTQRRLHFLAQLEGKTSQYNLRAALRLEGMLDHQALSGALDALVERHQILRSTFIEDAQGARQVVHPCMPVTLEQHDLSTLAPAAREQALQALMEEEARRDFALASEAPLAARLVMLGPASHAVLLTIHHLATDGTSMTILTREFMQFYDALRRGQAAALPALPFQYGDFAAWQQGALGEAVLGRQLDYWREALSGVPVVHGLPLDRPRPPQPDHHGAVHLQRIDGALHAGLMQLAQRHGCTLFVVVKALLAVLLGKHSGQRDILLGVPAAGRNQPGTDALVGFFANTLVFRHGLAWESTFASLLETHKAQAADVFAHQDVPFELLVETLQVERNLSHAPLIQVFLAFQNYARQHLQLDGLQVEPLLSNSHSVRFDLELTAQVHEDVLELQWGYATALFNAATIARLAAGLHALVQAVVADDQQPLSTLSTLTAADQDQLAQWNATTLPVEAMALPWRIAAQARRTPEHTAVEDGRTRLDYQTLLARADGLAQHLRARGIGPGSLVGVYLPRSVGLPVALLAVHRAGAAYVPLDPGYPAARLAYVVEDSGLQLVLTEGSLAAQVSALSSTVDVVRVEDVPATDTELAVVPPQGDDLAYVIYTSGSTGRPKGVMVEHRQLANFHAAMRQDLDLDLDLDLGPARKQGVWLAVTACSFDISILELLCPLAQGFTVVLGDHQRHAEPGYSFAALLTGHQVTHLQCTPSLLRMYMELPDFCQALAGLQVLMVGGEACPAPLVARLQRHTRARLVNLYGPTETTIWSSCAALGSGRAVTIGRPVANTRFHVVDEALRPVAIGVQGELLIGGDGVSRGYLGRDDLTAERFVALPDGERVYRTGDLVRWLDSGELLYVGRCDAQVKIRGHRVELGEIEAQLVALADVREAAVTLHAPATGEPFLAAYMVAHAPPQDQDAWLLDCRTALSRELTGYMMPSAFMLLDRLPMTPNGKIDRNALPAPQIAHDEPALAPRTPLETTLLAAWERALQRSDLGVNQNFFTMGGHSLLATRLVMDINAQLQSRLRLVDVFLHQTVAEQADYLQQCAEADDTAGDVPITPLGQAEYPLSHTQRRLHFLAQLEGKTSQYNLRAALRLEGMLDHQALSGALDALVERHQILRSTFIEDAQGARQVVHPCMPVTLEQHDLSTLAPAAREQALQALMEEEARRDFALASEAPLAARLVMLGPASHAVLLTIHHLATDGTSMTILTREFMQFYDALRRGQAAALPALPFQYGDFAAWQQGALGEAVLGRQLDYWREALSGVPVVHGLPLDRPRPPQPDHHGAVHLQRIDGALHAGLMQLAQRHGCTLFVVVKALLAVLLGKHSGQRDIVLGVPAAGRNQPGTDALVGFFANTLVFRHGLAWESTFASLLETHKAQAADVFAHQDVPFELLVETLQVERNLSHAPLIQVFLAFQNYARQHLQLDGLQVEPLLSNSHSVRFDLELTAQVHEDVLELQWGYATALFNAATIARLAAGLHALVQAVVADDQQPLSTLSTLTAADQDQLAQWNATTLPVEAMALPWRIAAQARRTPEHTAVEDGRTRLDYQTLLARADGLAQHLRARGIGPGSLVGVYLPRSVDLPVALLAVHRAGAAYVPLDPGYPAARLAYVVEDSGLQLVLTEGSLAAQVSALSSTVDVVRVEDVPATDTELAVVPPQGDDLAYVIYTSGSTGRPKGVMVEHRQLANFHAAMRQDLDLDLDLGPARKQGVWLAVTACSFDISILELLCPLAQGFTVVLGDHQRHAEPGYSFAALLTGHQVTHLQCTPSLLRMYMELPDFCQALAGLQVLMVGGEACPAPLVARLQRHTRARLVNLYGPTETTIWSSCAALGSGRAVTIGRPVANTRFHVVDEALRPVAIGVQGELLIGGDGVSRGYLGRDDLTAERFVALPDGERVYRTGDLVRWLDSGELLYVGRCDAQVKIRGHRVELGEIEAQLVALADVREAAVTLHAPATGEPFLAAYMVAHAPPQDQDAWLLDCRTALSRELTGYMMPSAFMLLDRLPMTPNGKIDRNALPAPQAGDVHRHQHTSPDNEVEARLQVIWGELLGRDDVSTTANYFEAGGHSLLATRLLSGIRSAFDVELSLREIFQHTTIRAQAVLVSSSPRASTPALLVAHRPARIPLSAAQQRLWFVSTGGDGDGQYGISTALRLQGRLRVDAIATALDLVQQRHEILRTTYHVDADGAWQQIHRATGTRLRVMDWSATSLQQQEQDLPELITAEAARAYDLSADPVLRATLVALADDVHVLVLTLHHIAADGWSMDVLVDEFSRLYTMISQGQPAQLPPLSIQYADYALWQQEQAPALADGLAWWGTQLAGAPDLSTLPGDRPRPARMPGQGANLRSELPAALMTRVRSFCHAQDVTPFMLLEAVLALLVARYSDQHDVVIGTPVAGRLHREVEPLVGCFVNNLALRTQLAPAMPFDALLRATRGTVIEAYSAQAVPFDKVVERLQVERSLGHSPLFQVLFTLQNTPQRRLELPGLRIEGIAHAAQTSKYDLELTAWEHEGALRLSWQYATALFDAATIAQIADHYTTLLQAVLDAPATPVFALPMMHAQEHARWDAWNATARDYPRAQCVHALFQQQVQRTPQALALTDGTRELSYAALDAWSSRAAHALRAQGAGPGSVVGLHVARSLEQVVGVLAILKAGAAYLPLEPEHPDARLAYMCSDSAVSQVLTVDALAGRGRALAAWTLCLDDQDALSPWPETAPLVEDAHPEQLAYLIYTSGSTGQPKGVRVPHRGVVNYLEHARGYLQPGHHGAVMGTPLSFDATVTTLFVPLLAGRCLVVLPTEAGALFSALAHYLFEDGRDWLFKLTPAHLDGLFATHAGSAAAAQRRHCLVIGGEQLTKATVARWQRERLPLADYVNEYGPTETVVGCSVYTVRTPADLQRGGHAVAIGRPIQNTRLHILNALDQPVPLGAVGELCIGGDGVTEGYQNLPEQTDARFRMHCMHDGRSERLYHSGDLVRCARDGELEYLGRRDEQVKLRGYRIELGEIEARLREDPRVSDAVALVQGDGDGRRVVAFVVSDVHIDEQATFLAALQQSMARTLAEYMRPSALGVLTQLPLTHNGKVDRAALPLLAMAKAAAYRAPSTATETVLATVWQHLLDREEPIGTDDNFFRLGGHSLLATRMILALNQRCSIALGIADAFQSQTLAALAARADEQIARAHPMEAPIQRRAPGADSPLSYAQQRLWFIDRLSGGSREYQIVLPVKLHGRLDMDAVVAALTTIIQRHDVLRTTYVEDQDGRVLQHVQAQAAFALSGYRDLRTCDPREQQKRLDEQLREAVDIDADLSADPVLRATLVALADDVHVLVLTLHHIAADGWSMDVLVDEFSRLYTMISQGQPAQLPPLSIQYADYALWQQEQAPALADGLAWWGTQLAGAPDLSTLPGDRPRPARMPGQGANLRSELPAALMTRVRSFCHAQDVTPFMLLEAVLALLVARYSDQYDVVIGTPVAGRLHREVEPLVGCFVNNLALRTQLAPAMPFDALLRATRGTVIEAYSAQAVPFDKVVERLQVERSLGHSPLFQVLFTLQNTPQRRLELPGLRIEGIAHAAQTSKYDLELTAWEHEGALRLSWQYATALFDAATIAQIADHYTTLLQAVLDAPATPVFALPMMHAQEHARWDAWNATARDYPRAQCVHALFQQQVQRTPQALALTDGTRELSYAALDAWSSRAAHALRAQGAGPGSVVGLHVARSLEQVVGVLAILKAGAAYLPLEPEHPDARLAYMCSDSAVSQVLTVDALAGRGRALAAWTLCLDDQDALSPWPETAPLVEDAHPEQLAYLIYTSGSTGQPKGVRVPHRGVVNYLEHARGYLQPGHHGAVMGTPLSFDATVTTLFVPLLAGRCLVVLPTEAGALFSALAHYLFEDGRDWLFKLTPAHLDGLFATHAGSAAAAQRRHCLVIGGEQLTKATVARWQRERLPLADYVNEYGPTETVVGCSVYTVRTPADLQRGGHAVAIGRPIQNTRLHILNALDQPVPLGAVGELCIGGDGVTEGYQNLPEQTDARFRMHCMHDGRSERLYHSGDLVRCARDGELEYLGRRDEQVKLRGYRIELGEIEARLREDPRVSDAVALVQGDGDGRRVVAFVVSDVHIDEQATFLAALQQSMARTLAEYMRPSALGVLTQLPLTHNGKVDRAALPLLAMAKAAAYRAPSTATETVLATVWQHLLDREEPIGADDNFFRLGGHSLLATRMILEINTRWPDAVQLKDVFEQQSLVHLARYIDCMQEQAVGKNAGGTTGTVVREEMEW